MNERGLTKSGPAEAGPPVPWISSRHGEASCANPWTLTPSEKNPTKEPASFTPLMKVPETPKAAVCDDPGASYWV